MELVRTLTQALGVDESQAMGGGAGKLGGLAGLAAGFSKLGRPMPIIVPYPRPPGPVTS